jgi:Pyruvate/2-oxoacid:ferredoxin oxidoreductase gamma subunit
MTAIQEREVLLTGIGGQGVQLAAKVLALAATFENLEVMSLGTYGGTMRGGNTDATVVIGRKPIVSPPIVSRAWSAIVVHPRYFESIERKLLDQGLIVVDADLLEEALPNARTRLISVDATTRAREVDAPKAAALVLLGAFVSATGIVSHDAIERALEASLPRYRKQTLDSNLRALSAGRAAVDELSSPAWTSEAA